MGLTHLQYRRIMLVCIFPTFLRVPLASKATFLCILSLLFVIISSNLKPYELDVINSFSGESSRAVFEQYPGRVHRNQK